MAISTSNDQSSVFVKRIQGKIIELYLGRSSWKLNNASVDRELSAVDILLF